MRVVRMATLLATPVVFGGVTLPSDVPPEHTLLNQSWIQAERDPKTVGFNTAECPGRLWLNTAIPANLNGGHSFEVTDVQRWTR